MTFRICCIVTINRHIVERCILLGRAEISDSDRDTIVHRSGISIPIMNRQRGKLRFFKFGTNLEAKFTSATNRFVEPQKEGHSISAGGKGMTKSPYSWVRHQPDSTVTFALESKGTVLNAIQHQHQAGTSTSKYERIKVQSTYLTEATKSMGEYILCSIAQY